MKHETVLKHEAIEALDVKASGIYVDGTFGRGGHSKALLEHLSSDGRLVVFDKDPEAIKEANMLGSNDARVCVQHASFAEMKQCLERMNLTEKVDGILLDLGLSSPQLDEGERGFSFMRNGPLDMRMDNSRGLSAAQWLAQVEEQELAEAIKLLGEERFSKRIASAIVAARAQSPIQDTATLADIVSAAIPRWEKHKHPATRTFQAIRIVVNRELEDLKDFLSEVMGLLKKGGRLVVISFHSLEDRIVKQWMKTLAKGDVLPSYIPVVDAQINRSLSIIGKAIKPSAQEIQQNPRARSAVMRVAEKI